MQVNALPTLELVGRDRSQDRYIVVGSLARAAILEDKAFFEPFNLINRDVDIIDTTGQLCKYYEFNDAGPIDVTRE